MRTSTRLKQQIQVSFYNILRAVFRVVFIYLAGNIHGMPVSYLLSLSNSTSAGPTPANEPAPFSWLDSIHLSPARIAYIGLRDIDAGEKALLRKHNIAAFSMHEVDRYGIGQVVEMALDKVNPGRDRPIHLSFDVDALDPSVAPSTGTPVRGGLTFREGHYICERIYETGLLVAVDLMVLKIVDSQRRCTSDNFSSIGSQPIAERPGECETNCGRWMFSCSGRTR